MRTVEIIYISSMRKVTRERVDICKCYITKEKQFPRKAIFLPHLDVFLKFDQCV